MTVLDHTADAFQQRAKAVLVDHEAQTDYYGSQLPCVKDGEITELVEQYLAADREARPELVATLDEPRASWFATYAHRMAILAVRKRSPDVLRNAIVALTIAAVVQDYREIIMTTSVLYRAARLLDLGDAAFRDAAGDAPNDATRRSLLGFLDRPENMKTIESMGYREETGKNGLVIVYGKMPVPPGFS